jgi:hypothetical protein
LDQIAGDPSGYSDLASLLQGDGASTSDSPKANNEAVADVDSGADSANLDSGGESVGGTASPDLVSANSGNVNNSAGGDASAGGSGGNSGSSAGNQVVSNFSEGGFSEGGGGAVTPLPAGAWAGLLVIPALALSCRGRLRRTAR